MSFSVLPPANPLSKCPSFTVRKSDQNFGVERTFPYECPSIDSVKVLRKGKVRRSKLYYLRGLSEKRSRIKELR